MQSKQLVNCVQGICDTMNVNSPFLLSLALSIRIADAHKGGHCRGRVVTIRTSQHSYSALHRTGGMECLPRFRSSVWTHVILSSPSLMLSLFLFSFTVLSLFSSPRHWHQLYLLSSICAGANTRRDNIYRHQRIYPPSISSPLSNRHVLIYCKHSEFNTRFMMCMFGNH